MLINNNVQPKIPGVDNAQELEAYLVRHPFGLLRLDLVDCFLDADLAIDVRFFARVLFFVQVKLMFTEFCYNKFFFFFFFFFFFAWQKILSKVPRIAIAIENSDKREQCVYYFKSSQKPAFEEDLQTMWAELQLPKDGMVVCSSRNDFRNFQIRFSETMNVCSLC